MTLALLLDLDDTLLDYSGGADECWHGACATVAGPLGVDVAALVQAITETRRWFWNDPVQAAKERKDMLGAWAKIAAHGLDRCGGGREGLCDAIAAEYLARRWAMMQLFPDALAALEQLRGRGVPMALVTNGDAGQQRQKIERWGLAPFFDAIVIEGEFGVGKPHESVYRHVLTALGVDASGAWMVGDNLEWDVAAPQRLGLRGIWIDRAGTGVPRETDVRPDHIISSLSELPGLL